MRIHSTLRNCVVFLGTEQNGQFTPVGTGFFIGVEIGGKMAAFIATALHVVDQIQGDYLSVRVNLKSGGCHSFQAAKHYVVRDSNNDLAIVPLIVKQGDAITPDEFEYGAIPTSRENMEGLRREIWNWGLGDEVYVLGLYTSHYGSTRNAPVARIGNLAAMLEEKVRGPAGQYIDAYLIELKTIAGLSGSPVFVNPPRVAFREGVLKHLSGEEPPVIPLGMLIGYHVVESKEDQIAVPQFGGAEASGTWPDSIDQRNTGFGVVVPFERIMELVETPAITGAIEQQLAVQGTAKAK